MRIHESGLDRTPDTPTTSNTSTVHTPTLVPSVRATTTTTTTTTTTASASSVADTDTADFSCPHCPRTFTSRIGLVGHLRIHRTETGEPVPGAPTYTHQARLNCPHCPRTFRHRIGLFGHMRMHDDLRRLGAIEANIQQLRQMDRRPTVSVLPTNPLPSPLERTSDFDIFEENILRDDYRQETMAFLQTVGGNTVPLTTCPLTISAPAIVHPPLNCQHSIWDQDSVPDPYL
nr:unnamed protein product [Spirometra erinaceieuropaei]